MKVSTLGLSTMQSPQMTALVRHELNYPLSTLQETIRLLSTGRFGELSTEGAQLLDHALVSLDRLTRLAQAIDKNQPAADSLLSLEQIRLLQLKQDLPTAIEQDEFYLVYQPIVEPSTQKIIGLEALARWCHPNQGMISPTVFIPLAEETNLIHDLGRRLIEKACYQLRQWQDQLPSHPPLHISVNVSALQLLQLDFPKFVGETLKDSQIEPRSLRFEITESALLENNEVVSIVLHKLGKLGVKLHMDDFGTGYSTLSRLQVLPVDTLKVDRSFVANRNWEICEIILALAEKLNFNIIVEGVETHTEVTKLQEMGFQAMQGYFFSAPLEVEAATALLNRFQSHEAFSPKSSTHLEILLAS